ncbi:MAG: BatA and WFA domain-containing protein [Verrucomicrobiota bacterium]
MNWLPGFLNVPAAWLFLLIPPLVAFYFLKLRRPKARIPSLVLWQQVINDQRVNSPFQKFKKNLLLLFQLLLLLFLILAAMQPFLPARNDRGDRLPLLIDTSASMGALDKPGGRSRLEEAKEKAREVIDGLLRGQEISLLSISDRARQHTGFTDDKRELLEALEAMELHDVPSRIEDGFRMAQALSRSNRFEEILFLSDGNVDSQAALDLPFRVDYRQLEKGGTNLGITACAARRTRSGDWDVFVEISASGTTDLSGLLTLEVVEDGASRELENKTITASPETGARALFRVDGDASSFLRVTIEADDFDSLPSDNIAYLTLEQSRPLRVLVPESLLAYRHALSALPNLELIDPVTAEPGIEADLLFSESEDDIDQLSARVACFIGFVPPALQALVSIEEENSQIVDWRRDAAALQHVDLAEVILIDQVVRAAGADASDFGDAGFEILIDGERGPVLLRSESSEQLTYALLVHTQRSTLPYCVGFPVFVANLVQRAKLLSGLAESQGPQTGILPELMASAGESFSVRGPGAFSSKGQADEGGLLKGIAAPRSGLYRLESAKRSITTGAALLDGKESRLEAGTELQFNEYAVTASEGRVRTDKPLWWPLAFLALGFLLVEWWYFQRRPGGWAHG